MTFTKFASDIVVKKDYYPLQLKLELFAPKFNKILSDADFADVADEQLWGEGGSGRAGLSSRLYWRTNRCRRSKNISATWFHLSYSNCERLIWFAGCCRELRNLANPHQPSLQLPLGFILLLFVMFENLEVRFRKVGQPPVRHWPTRYFTKTLVIVQIWTEPELYAPSHTPSFVFGKKKSKYYFHKNIPTRGIVWHQPPCSRWVRWTMQV